MNFVTNLEVKVKSKDMKKLFVVFGFVFSLFLLTSCTNDDGGSREPYPIGGITMVNGYAGSPAVWYVVDGRLVQAPYYGLAFKKYDFTRLFVGNRLIEVKANQKEQLVENTRLQVKDNQSYTSFVGGNAKDNAIHFITEDHAISLGEQGNIENAGIRFFNLTGEDLAVDVKLDDQIIFANRNSETELSAKENEKFIAQLGKSYTLTVQDKNGKEIVKRERVLLEKGRYFSLILVGSSSVNEPYYLGIVK